MEQLEATVQRKEKSRYEMDVDIRFTCYPFSRYSDN